MHDTTDLVEARIARFLDERVAPATHRARRPLTLSAWEAPDEPVPFEEAMAGSYEPVAPGATWGKPWGTTWFHATGSVPATWPEPGTRVEAVVDLGFSLRQPGFQAEGLVFTPAGDIIKAVEPFNDHVPWEGATEVDFYVEAASNPDFSHDWYTPNRMGDKATAGTDPIYTLRRIDLVLLDLEVWELAQDAWTLVGLMKQLGRDEPRRAQILRALERMVDTCDPDDIAGTASAGRDALAEVLASPASASAHRVVAVGHAHIDSAWLWPVRETIRKCARTFSNVLELMDRDEMLIFACSSAQQFAWMKEHYPALFERIRARAREGRFVPVGGMWVESDTNMPGGEAMVRQLVTGKGFFMREFGIEPLEVWLPDSFGYSGALPQIVAAAGSRYFLTQKISWNETNVMPHHTFLWEGIDGTRVFTHFPPVDTYNAQLSGEELARAQRQFREHGASNISLVPFGWGDGGGGPTREMLAAARRTRDLEGSPTVTIASPLAFFEEAEKDYEQPPVWSGELYLEFHRGTYTSQAETKRGNRRSEHLLREAELWAATAAVRGLAEYPYAQLEEAWHTVLLQQFHDILPGSSIAWVYQVAEENYRRIAEVLEGIIADALHALAGAGSAPLLVNASPFGVAGVPALGGAPAGPAAAATLRATDDGYRLENELLSVLVDHDGLIVSLYDRAADRELVPDDGAANLLQLFRDTPNQWDAWDIDVHYRRHLTELRDADSIEVLPVDQGAGVRVTRRFGASTLTQDIVLAGGAARVDLETRVDWHERQKLLKLAVALAVHSDEAASEIQFGHIRRPTHANTSWDMARFETIAHRWVHVGESGYGVAVANDATYGHDITRHPRATGGTSTLVRESLLRAPLFPDPEADQGEHTFRTSIVAGAEILDAVEEGYRINLPIRSVTGAHDIPPLLRVDNPAVVIEAVKLAEDRSGDLIVRLYEARGGSASATLTADVEIADAVMTDLLERPLPSATGLVRDGAAVRLSARPFELLTVRLTPGSRVR